MMRSCQQGRSMIEMLGVLAIVGVLSIGGIAGYSKAMLKAKNSQLIAQAAELVMNVRSLYITQKDYTGLSSAALLKAGVVPKEMLKNENVDGNKIVHKYGGEVIVYTSKDKANAPKAFEIYLTGLSQQTCIAIATMDWGHDVSSGFQAVYIGSGEVTAPLMLDIHEGSVSSPEAGIYTPGQHANAVPLNVTDATLLCICPNQECVIGLKYS